jgi:lysophospholipase L1-like esterase
MTLVLGACATSAIQNDPRLYAAEVKTFIASDRAAAPDPCHILFVGSSSIVRWTSLSHDLSPIPILNRAFGGSQISDINYWFNKVVSPYQPRAIVFYAGENDIATGKTPEQVVADFNAFMKRKSRALGPTTVYFISLKPSKLRFDQFERQSQVNERIRRLSGERADLRFIDVVPLMLDHGHPKDLYLPDNLHMRPEGYALWTQAVRGAILPETDHQAQQCQQTPLH